MRTRPDGAAAPATQPGDVPGATPAVAHDRQPATAPPPGPVTIELAGAPGAGKTALLPAVLQGCRAAGLQPYTVEEAARPFAARTAVGRLAVHLPPTARRRVLWVVFRIARALGALRVARRHPGLVVHVARTQLGRPRGSDARRRRVVGWLWRTAGAQEFLRSRALPGEAVVVDEGLVHRVVQLHTSAVERPRQTAITRYLQVVPRTGLVVLVDAPAPLCRDRVHARGVWTRLRHREAADIDRFVGNAHRAIALAARELRDRPVVTVDNAGDLAAASLALERLVAAALRGGLPPPHCPVPALRMPRASRVTRRVTARRMPPAIDAGTCARVLERYGLDLVRPPANIPFGQRNDNVVVVTSAGRAVLRRYRDTAGAGSVAHEHAVLTELERRSFPAVRLHRTSGGDTVVVDGGQRYALFAYEDGRNMSSYVLPGPAARRGLLLCAGATLARLHRELAGYRPPVAHHLGHDPASGEPLHDLAWYLDALATLPDREPPAGAAGDHHRALSARAPELAAWLTALHATVTGADLPVVLIHGDFGVHNLLFRSDGVAVVGDFELARREWRLTDLVIVLSRIPPQRGRNLLAGYRSQWPIPDTEWRHLPAVWQYHLLTGAVRSWHNHFVHGGAARLATAHARVGDAERARTEVAALWS